MTINLTINGGLTSTPELRFSANGVAIASFTVASTERYKKDNEWVDGKKLFLRCSAFRDLAENIAATNLDKGAQVSVTGKLHTRDFEDTTGAKRSVTELDVTDFSVSLKRATAQVTRKDGTSRSHAAPSTQQGFPSTPAPYAPTTTAQADVWGAPNTDYGADQSLPF